MDKLSKKLLDFMIERGNAEPTLCSLYSNWDSVATISITDLCVQTKRSEEAVRGAIVYLEENDYVKFKELTDRGKQIAVAFYLTHKGLNYKEFERLANIEFISKSVLVPIIIAFITTVITGYLLPQGIASLTDFLSHWKQ